MFGSALLYYLVLKPISLLPYPLLYGLSDFFFVILYYLIPYRKKVVMSNLAKAFPEKSEAELKIICRKFYRHFCDLVLESIKNFSISDTEARKRFVTVNPELINDYAAKGQSVIVSGGHYTNWELWAISGPQVLKPTMLGIYKKLSNKYFDQKMRESRGKFGMKLIRTLDINEYLKKNQDELKGVVLAFDQSPSDPKKCVWIKFMGMETGALYGTEKFAKEHNFPVIYGRMNKLKRGYYSISYELIAEPPYSFESGEILQRLHDELEKDIRKAPEYWLWTHKRWKHKRPA
jgi:KDO2-lipid IV(A) lauroyltransferase